MFHQNVSYSSHSSPASAPPTPNLLHPLTFRLQAHVSTLSSIQINNSASLAHSPHPLHSACSFSTSTPLSLLILQIHSAHLFSTYTPLVPSPHPPRSARSFSISTPPTHRQFWKKEKNHMKMSLHISSILTVPVFKFKFLHYASHQKRQICVCYGVFFTHKNKLNLRNINGRNLHCCYHKSRH